MMMMMLNLCLFEQFLKKVKETRLKFSQGFSDIKNNSIRWIFGSWLVNLEKKY